MILKRASFLLLFISLISWDRGAEAGVLKSLDQEIADLVGQTDPYLVTVRGGSGWRNLVATGIIFDSRGYVLTSSQIYGAGSFSITFKNGRSIRAEKVGVDQVTGLAVLKVSPAKSAIPQWGNTENLQEGALVAVVGNSFEVPATVSFGGFIGMTEDGLMRLGVDVNPGASGGAVLDVNGELIGILVAKEAGQKGDSNSRSMARASNVSPNIGRLMTEFGVPITICYAVPVSMARNILGRIIIEGEVRRGFLGITAQNLDRSAKEKYGLTGGIMVTDIDPNSPAELAGIRKGDIIVNIDHINVNDRADLYSFVCNRRPGSTIKISLLRAKNRLTVEATLTQMQERPFISGLELTQSGQNRSDAGFDERSPADMAAEIRSLKTELQRLRSELNDLKKEMLK